MAKFELYINKEAFVYSLTLKRNLDFKELN